MRWYQLAFQYPDYFWHMLWVNAESGQRAKLELLKQLKAKQISVLGSTPHDPKGSMYLKLKQVKQ
jgi:hypothetical protein